MSKKGQEKGKESKKKETKKQGEKASHPTPRGTTESLNGDNSLALANGQAASQWDRLQNADTDPVLIRNSINHEDDAPNLWAWVSK